MIRKKFFENIKNDLQEPKLDKLFYLLEKAVKTNNNKIISYKNLISIGAENKGNKIDKNEYADLLCKFYKIWWENWLLPTSKSGNDFQKEMIKKIIEDKEMYPNNPNLKNDIFENMYFIEQNYLANDAWYFQSEYFCLLDTTNLFVHERKMRYCDVRLYLNIKIKNIPKLASILIDEALQKNVPLLFKFALNDNRNDNVVLYVKYEDFENTVKLVEEVKAKHPKLFESAKVKNPIMATYKGYMGFGEEPIGFGSYTSNRVDVLYDMFRELSKEYESNKNCLTKENIQKKFDEACKKNHINSKEFYKNYEPNQEDIFEK